jgi:hypothetical protein
LSETKPEISEDLKEIVSTTIESIKEGMKEKECGVVGTIDFEIAVIKSKEAKGGFRFLVADASGNYSNESVSKIKFKILGSKTKLDKKYLKSLPYSNSFLLQQ